MTTIEQDQTALDQLYRDFTAANLIPLWTAARRPDAGQPAVRGRATRVALGRAVPARRARGRPRAGRSGRRTPGHRVSQPGARPVSLRDAHAVGGHPVPRPARDRARTPPHADRVPVRARRRRRLDRRRGRPGRDAPRRSAAHRRVGRSTNTTTPPTSRWPGSTGWTSRSSPLDAGFFEFGPDELTTTRPRTARATNVSGAIRGCALSAQPTSPTRR